MNMNKLIYDECAYNQKLRQSVFPGSYMLYGGKYYNDKPCRIGFGTVGGNQVSNYSGNMVDLESNLMGLDRTASLCNSYQYNPAKKGCWFKGNNGIPYDTISCNSKNLNNLPTCQLVKYKNKWW